MIAVVARHCGLRSGLHHTTRGQPALAAAPVCCSKHPDAQAATQTACPVKLIPIAEMQSMLKCAQRSRVTCKHNGVHVLRHGACLLLRGEGAACEGCCTHVPSAQYRSHFPAWLCQQQRQVSICVVKAMANLSELDGMATSKSSRVSLLFFCPKPAFADW